MAEARSWRRSQSSSSPLGELEIGTQSAEHSLGAKAVSPLISQITGARIRYQFAWQQFRGLRSTQLRGVYSRRGPTRAVARPRDDNDDDHDDDHDHVRCRYTTKRETRNEGRVCWMISGYAPGPGNRHRGNVVPRSTSAVDVYSPKTGEGRNDGRWQRRLGLSFAN